MKILGLKHYNHEAGMSDTLSHWVPNSEKYSARKAVSDATGEAIGWICWVSRGYQKEYDPEQATTKDCGGKRSPLKDVTRGQVLKMEDHEQDDPIERLEAMTDADIQRWMDMLMLKGTKCIYTLSLAVSPRYHSHGVGSALIR
jgi:hypothetical protein